MAKPTMDDVAAKAGVSRALVSLVMRDSPRVSSHNREKVLAVAADLGYRPNVAARNLATGQTHTVGIVVNDLHNQFFTEMTEGVAAAAAEADMRVLLSSGWRKESGESQAIDMLLGLRVDGLLLASPNLSDVALEEFSAQAPTVIFGASGESANYDTVSTDEDHGAELVVEHLAALGHTRIAHIDGGDQRTAIARRNGFTDAMLRRGLAPIVISGDFREAAGFEGAETLMELNDTPTAIFAANDLSALGVLSKLNDLGRSVPRDISVVGFDDTTISSFNAISLTTVHQPRNKIGRFTMEVLLERIAGRAEARHEQIQPRLVERSTSGPAIP